MKIFITGATGFVGSHLVPLLQAAGHELFLLVRNQQKLQEFNLTGNIITGSLSPESNSWIDQLPEDLDIVIHLAGLVHSYAVEDFYQINATSTKILTKELAIRYPQLKFILLSSLAAFGPGTSAQNIVNEELTPHPVSHYGISKLTAEKFVAKYAPESWKITIIRPPMVIGPHDPAMLELFKMVKSRFVIYHGKRGLTKEYSFIAVTDLVRAIELVINHPHNTAHLEDYFCANTVTVYFKEILEEIKRNCDINFIITLRLPLFILTAFAFGAKIITKILPLTLPVTPDKVAEIKQRSWICSSTKFNQVFNFRCKENLEQIIQKTYQDYIKRGWL